MLRLFDESKQAQTPLNCLSGIPEKKEEKYQVLSEAQENSHVEE